MDLIKIAQIVNEKGVWTGALSPDQVEYLESLGFTVRELRGETGMVYRRCLVSRTPH